MNDALGDAGAPARGDRRPVRLIPGKVAAILAAGLSLVVLGGCSSPRTFSQLASDADAVPVPAGVSLVRQQRSVEDGPGFTTSKFNEVTDQYRSRSDCAELENAWAAVLQRQHRQFHLDNEPHKFGATGSLGIAITDRPENLGVTIGTDGACDSPFVYSFNNAS